MHTTPTQCVVCRKEVPSCMATPDEIRTLCYSVYDNITKLESEVLDV
jgi:hypothetical protein